MSGYDPLDDGEQQRKRDEIKLERKLAADNERDDIKWLMGSKRGRRIIWRLLERAGVFRSTFNTNAMTMAFGEGRRNEGLRLLDMIHSACPEQYHVMVSEANERRSNPDDGSSRNDH